MLKSYDNIIISKFLNKIWRRYAFFSNLGEQLIELEDFAKFIPDIDKNSDDILVSQVKEELEDLIDTDPNTNEETSENDEETSINAAKES